MISSLHTPTTACNAIARLAIAQSCSIDTIVNKLADLSSSAIPPRGPPTRVTQRLAVSMQRSPSLRYTRHQTRHHGVLGADEVTNQVLKKLDAKAHLILLRFFNEIWDTGVLPNS